MTAKVRSKGRTSKRRSESTEHVVYEYICRHPGLCTYDLAKRLKMTGGNLRSCLARLNKKGLIRFKFDRKNPRTKKLSYPISSLELLPKSLKVLARKNSIKIKV